MATMSPPSKRPRGMSAAEFDRLMKAAKLSRSQAAELLSVNRRTVIRWATGVTEISQPNALFIRDALKNHKK